MKLEKGKQVKILQGISSHGKNVDVIRVYKLFSFKWEVINYRLNFIMLYVFSVKYLFISS